MGEASKKIRYIAQFKARLGKHNYDLKRVVNFIPVMRRTVGQTDGNDLQLEDKSVSRFHALLLFKAGTIFVVDVLSSTGTFVNGVRLNRNEEREIRLGDVIKFGNVLVRISPDRDDSVEAGLFASRRCA